METQNDPGVLAAKQRLEASRRKLLSGEYKSDANPAPAATEPTPAPAPAPQVDPAPSAAPGTAPVVEEVKVDAPAAHVDPGPGPDPLAGTIEWYRTECAVMKKDKETLAGTLGAQIKNLKDENARLFAENEQLKSGAARPSEPAPAKEPEQLTATAARDLLKKAHPGIDYSAYDDDDVIMFALPLTKQSVVAESPKMDELQQTVEEMKKRQSFDRFCVAVEAEAPGFIAAQGNPFDDVPGDPGWAAFLTEPMIEGAALTRGEFMAQQGTPTVLAGWFRDYQKRAGLSPAIPVEDPDKLTLPSVEEQAAPVSVQAPPPQNSNGPRYKRSDVVRFRDDLNNRRLPYNAENQRLLRDYQLAEMEGRLD